MVGLLGVTYSNIEVLAFDNPVTLSGVDAVTFLCKGDSNTSDKNKTVCYVML